RQLVPTEGRCSQQPYSSATRHEQITDSSTPSQPGCHPESRFSSLQEELAHFPGVAGVQDFVQIAWAALSNDILYLLVHDVFVARQVVPCAKYTNGGREAGAMLHVREQEGVGRTRMMRVVNDEIRFGHAVAERNALDVPIGFAGVA